MIYAFDHKHQPGDVCSVAQCAAAGRAPVLSGEEVHRDVPMRILRPATATEYLCQPVPKGWCIPPLAFACEHIYEVEVLD